MLIVFFPAFQPADFRRLGLISRRWVLIESLRPTEMKTFFLHFAYPPSSHFVSDLWQNVTRIDSKQDKTLKEKNINFFSSPLGSPERSTEKKLVEMKKNGKIIVWCFERRKGNVKRATSDF